MNANVGSFLHRWATRDPARTAIIDSGRGDLACSYESLDREAGRVAAHLTARGLGPGDRIAVCTNNGLEFVAAWFGAVYAGCTTLPIPVMSTSHEIAFRLEHARCRALLCDAPHFDLSQDSKKRAGTDTEIIRVDEAIEAARGEVPPAACEPEALAMILYTSGTTGAAKGVCITHGSLSTHTAALVGQTLVLSDCDRVLGCLPLTHSYGIRMTLLVPFYAGASTIFVPRFSPGRTLDLCAKHEVTWLPGVPTMFVAWADATSQPAIPSLRWCMSAGAPLVEESRLRAEERLGATVRQGYGLTEATFSTINAPPDHVAPLSVGRPVSGVEIRIANENGETVPTAARGEVLVRGQNVMAGYLDDKTATAHVMRGGWLHTGDIGFVDETGRLTIVDRSKDLILRGGHSIYPFEIESAVGAHPAVADIAVVGEPDDYYGEEVVAVVVPRKHVGLRELDTWARERLSPYKVPRRYAFVDALPQGASGKTLKRLLRDRLISGELETTPSPDHGPTD
ncbi:MAG: AMP-binding protein [Myxococcales bacterium]|nr:AMP-binding protein [Myxococcales bacterium]MDH3485918.1 AMP-binding protein [Myxococcales bacterium]